MKHSKSIFLILQRNSNISLHYVRLLDQFCMYNFIDTEKSFNPAQNILPQEI